MVGGIKHKKFLEAVSDETPKKFDVTLLGDYEAAAVNGTLCNIGEITSLQVCLLDVISEDVPPVKASMRICLSSSCGILAADDVITIEDLFGSPSCKVSKSLGLIYSIAVHYNLNSLGGDRSYVFLNFLMKPYDITVQPSNEPDDQDETSKKRKV
jgi:hypothetical protein